MLWINEHSPLPATAGCLAIKPGGAPHDSNGERKKKALIEIEGRNVIPLEREILVGLSKHGIAYHEYVQFISHKTAESVFRRPDDRLATYVEAGVD